MMGKIKTDWTKIQPTVWHRNAFDRRLYLYISPSGKTHIAEWIDNIGKSFSTGHSQNYKFRTLCNREFTQYYPDTKKRTGWRRPSLYYDSLHSPDPDGFLDITCPRCAKLKPEFREPSFEVDMRLHESELLLTEDDEEYNHRQKVPHFHLGTQLSSDIIPKILYDPLRRCRTCERICTTDEIEARQKKVIESFHGGWRNPRGCNNWQAGVYATRQDALTLTDGQLRELSVYRLRLMYDYHIKNTWEHDKDMTFQVRILKILKEKERQ